jgi:tetratricopeptide (TPR) repeat protein
LVLLFGAAGLMLVLAGGLSVWVALNKPTPPAENAEPQTPKPTPSAAAPASAKKGADEFQQSMTAGLKALKENRFADAEKAFLRATTLRPQDAVAENLLKLARLEQHPPFAVNDKQIDPERGKRVSLLLAAARDLVKAGDLPAARCLLDKAHQMLPASQESREVADAIDKAQQQHFKAMAAYYTAMKAGDAARAGQSYSSAVEHYGAAIKALTQGIPNAAKQPNTAFWLNLAQNAIYDAQQRQETARREPQPSLVLFHPNGVRAVAITPDGTRLVTGCEDNNLKLWDLTTGDELFTFKGHTMEVYAVAISADGKRLASGSRDGTAKVWDAGKGNLVANCKGHSSSITGVALMATGQGLITSSVDGTWKSWNGSTGAEFYTYRGHGKRVTCVATDGRVVVSGGYDDAVRLYDTTTNKELMVLRGHSGPVYAVAISSDGKRIVSGSFDMTVRLWDAQSGKELCSVAHDNAVFGVAISANGKRIASACWDGTAKVWDDTGLELFLLKADAGPAYAVAISADGSCVVTGHADGKARVWQVKE